MDEPSTPPSPHLGPSLRRRAYELLEAEDAPSPAGRLAARLLTFLILLSTAAAVLDTVESLHRAWRPLLLGIEIVCVAAFTVEYAARVWSAVEDRAGRYSHPVWGRLRYMLTPLALVDLVAILPYFLAGILPFDLLLLRSIRILRVLKLTRYSPAMATIELVVVNERRSLLAAVGVLGVALLIASGIMYHVERGAQPEAFGSIPAAMWWAIATLTTVGYGDVAPVTALGRVIAGVVAMIGIFMFALPTAILGAGFLQEIQKRNFAAAAAMVSRASQFSHLDPPQLAELTALLRPRVLPPRYVIMRQGEQGDAMYFIDEGEVAVQTRSHRSVLGPGSFVGELALLEGRPRNATVTTLTTCRLLELSAGDFHRLLAGDETLRRTILAEAQRRKEGRKHEP